MTWSELCKGLGPGTSLAVSDAGSTKTAAQAVGHRFVVTCSTPTHIRIGPQATVAATTDDLLLDTGQVLELEFWTQGDGTVNNALAGICPAAGSGAVYLAPRRSV